MRTTLDLDDDLLDRATKAVERDRFDRQDTTRTTQTGVVNLGLQALLRQLAASRLAATYEDGAPRPTRRRRVPR